MYYLLLDAGVLAGGEQCVKLEGQRTLDDAQAHAAHLLAPLIDVRNGQAPFETATILEVANQHEVDVTQLLIATMTAAAAKHQKDVTTALAKQIDRIKRNAAKKKKT